MVRYEYDIYVNMLASHLKEERNKIKQQEAQKRRVVPSIHPAIRK
jgi:hypothetical protein